MRTVVIVGADKPMGQAGLNVIRANRGEFIVDGLSAEADDPHWLTQTSLEFTPLVLGLTDDYQIGAFYAEREDISIDEGLVEWELADLEVIAGDDAAVRVAGESADIVVIADQSERGRQACEAALQGSASLIICSASVKEEIEASGQHCAQAVGIEPDDDGYESALRLALQVPGEDS